jgi:hypothetical protein
VRVIGLEPTCREAPDPKSGVSANFTTPACVKDKSSAFMLLKDCKGIIFCELKKSIIAYSEKYVGRLIAAAFKVVP